MKLMWGNLRKVRNRQLVTCFLLVQLFAVPAIYAQETGEGQLLTTGHLFADTASIKAALSHAADIRERYIDSAQAVYEKALASSQVLEYSKGTMKSLFGLATVHSYKNEHQLSIDYARQTLQYVQPDESGYDYIALTYLLLSQTYYYIGRYDSCAYYRYAALGELETNHVTDPRMQMKVYCSILQFWLNAHEDIRNDRHIQQVMQQVSVIEKDAAAKGDENLLMNIYFYKGGYYNNIGENDSARYYCNRTVELGTKLHAGPSFIAGTLINIALTYIEDKQPDKAIQYIQQAQEAMPELGRTSNRQYIFANIFLGEAYCLQKNYAAAIRITEPALAQATALNILHITDHAHKTLADAYEATRQYKKAALHRKEYSVVRDSLMKAEKLELVYNVEMKYRIADKNKELAQKELAIARNESRIKTKNLWITGISASLLLILLIGLLLYRNNLQKQKLQAEKIRNLRQEVQITSLQAMIAGEEKERSRIARELHDGMGGLLGTIRMQVSAIFRRHQTNDVHNDFLEVMQLLEEASIELRKTAHNLMPEILLQEGLAKASALFCERVRKGHTLDIHFESWGDVRRLPTDFELSVYRIIQELIHNILKHARASQALVQIVYHETQLCVTVEDNGAGMPQGVETDGMGLKTIRERIASLNGQIDIASSPGEGTSVYMEFNIKQNTPEICT